MKYILPILLILTLFACKQPQEVEITEQESLISDFISLVESDLKADNINGCVSLAILHGDSLLATNTCGYTSPDQATRADASTMFRIGSITKSFTGFLLVKLHQDEIIDLDDAIEKYLPEMKLIPDYSHYPAITFRQLASHTSGLDRESSSREVNSGTIEEWEEMVLLAIPETGFRSAPGERFSYSNIGFGILGLAISRAAEKPYVELVEDIILLPLEMTNTFFQVPDKEKSNLAQGMAGGPTAELDLERPLSEHQERGYRIPNGGLYSTPEDLSKFMMACMGYSKILTAENLHLLQTTQTPTSSLRSNYSFGFDLYSDQGINTVGHGGSTPGYAAHIEFEKDSKYGVVIMRNYNFGNTNLDLRCNSLLRCLTKIEE
jgi:CubicO group peptidase (beta-lactamase class C family)